MRDLSLGCEPVQQAYDAVMVCLWTAHGLDANASTTAENLLVPQRPNESDEEFEESNLLSVESAAKSFPALKQKAEAARRYVDAIRNELAGALDTPATIGRWNYVSFHDGVLRQVEGVCHQIERGLETTNPHLSFVDKWRAFCKQLAADGSRLFDLRTDKFTAMLAKEAIRAAVLWEQRHKNRESGEQQSASRAKWHLEFSDKSLSDDMRDLAHLMLDNLNSENPKKQNQVAREFSRERGGTLVNYWRQLKREGHISYVRR